MIVCGWTPSAQISDSGIENWPLVCLLNMHAYSDYLNDLEGLADMPLRNMANPKTIKEK